MRLSDQPDQITSRKERNVAESSTNHYQIEMWNWLFCTNPKATYNRKVMSVCSSAGYVASLLSLSIARIESKLSSGLNRALRRFSKTGLAALER
jgi:hypothetical protein